jgi:microsomal dipeptidase-like Zn-dependent dipeptidase
VIALNGQPAPVVDALQSSKWTRELFDEWRIGAVDCVHVTCALWEDSRTTLDTLAKWYRLTREHGDIIALAESVDDIWRAIDENRTAVVLGFQSASPIEDDLGLVEVFHRLGVRVMQLTYNNQSLVGGSCYELNDGGLSRFGREVIKEMNRVGMLVDLSHVGERTSLEAIEYSERPVAITHSNPLSFLDHPRNKSKAVLEAMAEKRGVVGLTMYPPLIGGKDATLEAWTAMVMDTVEQIGIDCVGIGSDASRNWDDDDLMWVRLGRWTHDSNNATIVSTRTSWPEWPRWFQTPADFPLVAEGLRKRGFTDADVSAILGGNWMRVFAETFEPAAG